MGPERFDDSPSRHALIARLENLERERARIEREISEIRERLREIDLGSLHAHTASPISQQGDPK